MKNGHRQREAQRQNARNSRRAASKCSRCGGMGGHLVPASLGEPAFFLCDESAVEQHDRYYSKFKSVGR